MNFGWARPAVRTGALDRPALGGRHVEAARQPDQLRGRHRAGDRRSLPRPAPRPPPLPGIAIAPLPIPPTGFAVEVAPPGDLGAALWERLYWWPEDGWQHRTVASSATQCLLVRGGLQPAVVGLRARRTRYSTPPPTAPTRCFSRRPRLRRRVWPRPFDPGPPDLKFEYGRWLLPARGRGAGGQRTFA